MTTDQRADLIQRRDAEAKPYPHGRRPMLTSLQDLRRRKVRRQATASLRQLVAGWQR